MDRRAMAGLAACVMACSGACSLLVSTSDLAGGPSAVSDPGPRDATSSADADADAADRPADAGPDVATDPHLIGEWTFDEVGASIARDTSGYEHTATLTADAQLAAGGVHGGALALSGQGYAEVTTLDGPLFPSSGTLSLWVSYDFSPTDMNDRLILDDYDTSRPHLFFRRAAGNQPSGQFQVTFQEPEYVFNDYVVMSRGLFTHVVVTWDAAARVGALYVGGKLFATHTYTKSFAPTGQVLRFGEQFIGKLDEIRLYDRALTSLEVAQIP